jgi:hypothetical protein
LPGWWNAFAYADSNGNHYATAISYTNSDGDDHTTAISYANSDNDADEANADAKATAYAASSADAVVLAGSR